MKCARRSAWEVDLGQRFALYALASALSLSAGGFAQAQTIPEGQSCGGLLCDMGVFGQKTPPAPPPAPPPVAAAPAPDRRAETPTTLEPAAPKPTVRKRKRIATAKPATRATPKLAGRAAAPQSPAAASPATEPVVAPAASPPTRAARAPTAKRPTVAATAPAARAGKADGPEIAAPYTTTRPLGLNFQPIY